MGVAEPPAPPVDDEDEDVVVPADVEEALAVVLDAFGVEFDIWFDTLCFDELEVLDDIVDEVFDWEELTEDEVTDLVELFVCCDIGPDEDTAFVLFTWFDFDEFDCTDDFDWMGWGVDVLAKIRKNVLRKKIYKFGCIKNSKIDFMHGRKFRVFFFYKSLSNVLNYIT